MNPTFLVKKYALILTLILGFASNSYAQEARTWKTWFEQSVTGKYFGNLPTLPYNILPFNWAQDPMQMESMTYHANAKELKAEIERIGKVNPQLVYLSEMAKRLKVKVYLTNDSSASLAHYAANRIRHREGNDMFQSTPLDDHFEHIFKFYRSKGLNLQVEGNALDVDRFKRAIKDRFKQAQINITYYPRADFIANDTHSLSKIDVSDFTASEELLKDISSGQLSIQTLPRNTDAKTKLETLIRILIYASQFDMPLSANAKAYAKEVISSVGNQKDLYQMTKEESTRLDRLASHIYFFAQDLEKTDDLLKNLDPTRKLSFKIHPTNDPQDKIPDISIRTDKQILPSLPLGRGFGKTAAQLGIEYATHQTRHESYFNSITSSPLGKPNAYISRQKNRNNGGDVGGELARRGNGHYAMIGNESIWSLDYGEYLVVYKVHPDARLGTDFFLFNNEIIFLNATALEVSEDIHKNRLSPSDYFKYLATSQNDPSIVRSHKRSIIDLAFSPQEREKVDLVALEYFSSLKRLPQLELDLFKEYLKLPIATKTGRLAMEKLVGLMMQTVERKEEFLNADALRIWASSPYALKYPQVLKRHFEVSNRTVDHHLTNNYYPLLSTPIAKTKWFKDNLDKYAFREEVLKEVKQSFPEEKELYKHLTNDPSLTCSSLFQ